MLWNSKVNVWKKRLEKINFSQGRVWRIIKVYSGKTLKVILVSFQMTDIDREKRIRSLNTRCL